MRLDETGLDEYTDAFAWSASRQEVNDGYDVPSDGDEFRRYLGGLPPTAGWAAGWHAWLDARRAERRNVYRVRVLYRRPTPYQLFEIERGYLRNAEHGENTRILDLTEIPRPGALVDDETWVLDGARVAVLTYADDATFRHADTHEGDDAQPWVDSVTSAWEAGEDLHSWWARHAGYHRENWPSTGD